MKKIFCILSFLLLITACSSKLQTKPKKVVSKKETTSVIKKEPAYVDNNPIKVGLYDDKNLVTTYNTKKENSKDIVFSVCYTQDSVLDSAYIKYDWDKYYNKYTNIDKYKIGFNLSLYSGNKHITGNILGPDIYHFSPYFYVYLYDDIHQIDGAWYSHLEEKDIKDNTIFSSIKIYTVDTTNITSPIELTVFTYDGSEDFDSNNNYRGNSKYTIQINWTS